MVIDEERKNLGLSDYQTFSAWYQDTHLSSDGDSDKGHTRDEACDASTSDSSASSKIIPDAPGENDVAEEHTPRSELLLLLPPPLLELLPASNLDKSTFSGADGSPQASQSPVYLHTTPSSATDLDFQEVPPPMGLFTLWP